MHDYRKELAQVVYNDAAIKTRRFFFDANCRCFQLHWHDRMELLRVFDGELYVTLASERLCVRPGELVLIPPRIPHGGHSAEQPADYAMLSFDIRSFYNDSEACRSFLPAMQDGRAVFHAKSCSPDVVACIDAICLGPQQDALAIVADMYRLFSLLHRHCLIEIRESVPRDPVIMEMIRYMEEHFSKPLTSSSIAAHFGYTLGHFCSKFKEATGLTPMTYLKIYRMEEAGELLADGMQDIGELAAACGFADANYFTRCFKAHFGFPPSHFPWSSQTPPDISEKPRRAGSYTRKEPA